ncbi:hypothetical protein LBMAG42_56320 [Deltaproteobacteria bacterium]|nr:hypothetical protein LBMAG42_56320 [Deltaproteobacteria bacterium]
MLIVALLYGCTLISDAEVEAKFGEPAPDADADVDADSDSGTDAGEDTSVDSGTDSDTDTGADSAVDTNVDTDTDTGPDTAVDTGVDTGVDPRTDYISVAGGTMLFLSGGTFSMGSGLGDPDGAYVDHDVTLTHDFYLAQTETTRGEWEADPANASWTYSSLPDYPCTGVPADCPADTMTWYDAAMYANWLSVEEGRTECYLADGTDIAAAYIADPYSCPGYRLPTEAEWEYAARAGVNTRYAGSNTAADVAWTYENAYRTASYAHESCSLAANAWGLCDMSGNLTEWTNDWYGVDGGYSTGAAEIDPPGPSAGSYRVPRGGDWRSTALSSTVSYRGMQPPEAANYTFGFRLARSVAP